MPTKQNRNRAKSRIADRNFRQIDLPVNSQGRPQRASEYFGENVFNIATTSEIPDDVRKELIEVSRSGKRLNQNHAEIVAQAVTKWRETFL